MKNDDWNFLKIVIILLENKKREKWDLIKVNVF